jgi:tellurite resistance protein TerC
MIDRFQYLKVSLAFVLMIVGIKMMIHGWLKEILGQHFNLYLLGAVICVLLAGVVVSLMKPRQIQNEKA